MATQTDVKDFVTASRSLPTPQADGQAMAARADRYGGAIVALSPRRAAADEGASFTTTNPTIGTTISPNAVETSYSATRGFFVIYNKDVAGGKRIFLDKLRLLLGGTAPTTTVSLEFAVRLDNTNLIPTTAANRTLLTVANTNQDSSAGSVAVAASYANAGAMTIPTASDAVRIVARANIPTGLGIVGDQYVLQFDGEPEEAYMGLTATRATVPAKLVAHCPPVVIGPGQSAVIHRWWLTEATNAPAFEFELSWFER